MIFSPPNQSPARQAEAFERRLKPPAVLSRHSWKATADGSAIAIHVTNRRELGFLPLLRAFMTIEGRHFLETVPAGIFVAAIVYFSFRRRVQHSWRWRMIVSALLAVGSAPLILPDMSGGYSVPHFFPMIMFFIPALSRPDIVFVPWD